MAIGRRRVSRLLAHDLVDPILTIARRNFERGKAEGRAEVLRELNAGMFLRHIAGCAVGDSQWPSRWSPSDMNGCDCGLATILRAQAATRTEGQ